MRVTRGALVGLSMAFALAGCGPPRSGGDDDDTTTGDGGANLCAPNARFCASPSAIHLCSASGKTSTAVDACDLSTGVTCENGACIPACEAAAMRRSNIGCEYWPVDLPQFCDTSVLAGCPRSEQWAVLAANLNPYPVHLTIERNEADYGQAMSLAVAVEQDVAPMQVALILVPQREVDASSNSDPENLSALTSRAYRLTASGPVVAYQVNTLRETDSIDASLLIPTSGLDKRYRTIGWPSVVLDLLGQRSRNRGFMTIVGTQAQTHVHVTAGGRVVAGPGVAELQKDGTMDVTLGPFDVLHLAGTQSGGLAPPPAEGDLSGTIVQADQPVAVYAGASCANVTGPMGSPDPPDGRMGCCCDHIEEQVPPASALGTRFAVTRSARRSTGAYIEPDVWRILADQPGTTITTNLPAPWDQFTVEQNQVVEFWSQTNFTLVASKPVLLAQFIVSTEWGAGIGDPALTFMPPVDQARAAYVFLVPETYVQNWVVIGREVGTSVKLDGRDAPGEFGSCRIDAIGMLGGKAYESLKCPMTAGVHTLDASAPVTLIEYGYGSTGSIAYVGGADVKRINPIE